MARRVIERIRGQIRLGRYDMTAHAMEEMAEDSLDILDVEHALFSGEVARIDKSDPRGTKYVVEGGSVESAIGRRGGRTIYEYRTLSDYHSV